MRSEVDRDDSVYMILMNHLGFIVLSDIESVKITILTSSNEVDGLLRIPADTSTPVLKEDLLERSVASDIEKTDGPVVLGTSDQVLLRRVEFHAVSGISTPVEAGDGVRSLVVPDLDSSTSSGEERLTIGVVHVVNALL